MLGKKHKVEEVAPTAPLQRRIETFRAELEAFIDDRVKQLRQPGLPDVTIRQMLTGNSNCSCATVLKLLGDIERDREIAARQSA